MVDFRKHLIVTRKKVLKLTGTYIVHRTRNIFMYQMNEIEGDGVGTKKEEKEERMKAKEEKGYKRMRDRPTLHHGLSLFVEE